MLDLSDKGHKGKGVWTEFDVKEGEVVTFVVSRPACLNPVFSLFLTQHLSLVTASASHQA